MDEKTRIAPARQRIVAGTRLNDIYEIERLVAVGGMGEVYKGHAIQTGDAVAIKTIRPDLAENEAAIALFRKEASALHELYHEAIVRYFVFSRDPVLDLTYLAMEFVDGQALSERVKAGPLSFAEVDLLRRRVAAGLAAAHELGIIHRDLSPDNVILPGGNVGRAKIIDFGIARSTRLGEATVIGSGFAGKYNYVSPEQLGLHGGDVGPKSDIYSLGLVLAEALLGRPLDMGGSQSAIVEKRRAVPDLAGIDARMRPLITRMLQPRPEERPASMAEVAAWQPPAEKAPAGRRPFVLAGLAGAAAVAVAAGIAGMPLLQALLGPQPDERRVEAPVLTPASRPPAVEERATQGEPPPLVPDKGTPTQQETATGPVPQAAVPAATVTPPASAAEQSAPPAAPGPPATEMDGTSQEAPASTPAPARTPPLTGPADARPEAAGADPPPLLPGPSQGRTEVAARPAQPELVPTTPAVTAPAPAGPVPRIAEITRYIDEYSGGDCFFLNPVEVSANAAQVEGYGAATQPFVAFDEAFRQVNGFEAQISLRQVTGAQCPLVAFLRQMGPLRGEPPRLDIAAFSLRSGETLSGTVAGTDGREVTVLLVSDDGYVHNLASFLKKDAEALSFSLRVERTSGTGARPQVVLALASPAPLATLAGGKTLDAATLFPLLFAEIDRTGQKVGVAAKYFRLEE
ncbi:Protein kinase domain [Chelatococcus sambhunathii]|uniref:Protein kinase domain n=1 Tax=Chelatococcus sambhunathii TaxID=363953 RepID=A0ABP2ADD5_9HYPH|nr:serine/threonine-protein kinase [Chelatococcus sambhunathii]CUA89919.1 Protein kinase domain [Chelatococcus sambhunathii]